MHNTTTVHASRIARTLDAVAEDIRPQLLAVAAESCRLMLAGGWDPASDTYEGCAQPGDQQAAEDELGRRLEGAEVRALELCIKAQLAAAADARPHYAALGTDGRDPVVWGLGRSEDAAREDAMGELDGASACEDGLRIRTISAERYARIEGGEVDASDLW